MMAPVNNSGPIFVQIADRLADQVADGDLDEGAQIPSTNELAAFYRVNPATAARALSLLVDRRLAEKRRGVGMFVAKGARDRLVRARRRDFAQKYVHPLVTEAARLGIEQKELLALVRDELAATRTAALPASGSVL